MKNANKYQCRTSEKTTELYSSMTSNLQRLFYASQFVAFFKMSTLVVHCVLTPAIWPLAPYTLQSRRPKFA